MRNILLLISNASPSIGFLYVIMSTNIAHKKIRYFVSKKEEEFQKEFWRENALEGRIVIGIHLYSADTYKNYPHMEQLVQELLKRKIKLA